MDEIGARGVRFAATISPAPLTLPAHVSLMTALDPPAHGVRHNSIHRLNEGIPTLAERMREAGFAEDEIIVADVPIQIYADGGGGNYSHHVGPNMCVFGGRKG